MIEYIYKRLIKGVLMKEKIYTIPVNDAFSSDCECPICSMYKALEDDAVSYTMGPSYMEDDIRAVTDKKGFCQKHLKKVYDCENRLGFALVMKTHLDRVINDIESVMQQIHSTLSSTNGISAESGSIWECQLLSANINVTTRQC